MGRRPEMPRQCVRCSRPYPEYGLYCKACISHKTWLDAIKRAWEPDQVRVDGHLYEIHPEPIYKEDEPRPTGGRGFGGAEWEIKFDDGRVVVTRNLWSIGDIPDEYREALPGNAKFVYRRRWPARGGSKRSRS
jgi:hypothetical protein